MLHYQRGAEKVHNILIVFSFGIWTISGFYLRYIRSKCQKLMECLLVATASAFTGFITLFLVNDCQPVGRNPKLTEVTKVNIHDEFILIC